MAFSDTREASEEARSTARRTRSRSSSKGCAKLGVEYVLLNGGGLARENLRRFARELIPAFADGARMRDAG